MEKFLHPTAFLIIITAFSFLFAMTKSKPARQWSGGLDGQEQNFMLVIHGGAGTILKANMTPEQEKEYMDKLKEALQAGYKVLNENGTSLDAVEAVIKILENSPLFNAGKGAVFTSDGRIELDASIMDGKAMKAGACAGITTVKNPISLARKVMENTPHVLLVGVGAEKFAQENGLEIVDPKYFWTDKRWEQLQKMKEQEKQKTDSVPQKKGMLELSEEKKYGTVGCVALDKFGNLSAGTSTGGMQNKKFGRVGDSPIIGAGTYANNKTCAVSCTGHGEYFIRGVIAYDMSALMEYKGMGVDAAAEEVIMKKLIAAGGTGGLIALDSKGNFTMKFNTDGMYRGYIKSNGEMEVMIYK